MIKVIDDPCTAKVDTLYIVYYCIIYFSVGRDSLISTYPSKNGENQNKKKKTNAGEKTWERTPKLLLLRGCKLAKHFQENSFKNTQKAMNQMYYSLNMPKDYPVSLNHVHCQSIHNSQGIEIAKISSDECIINMRYIGTMEHYSV